MTVPDFINAVSAISLPHVFNPYRDVCGISDHSTSPAIRCRNLSVLLEAVANSPSRSLWLGRDLGYRGGRRTGIALTDEYHLGALQDTFRLSGITKATVEAHSIKERTATEVWKALAKINRPVLLWNAFPFHPFNAGDPLSNRRHTAGEFAACRHILEMLIEWIKPTLIVALGADAEAAVTRVGCECIRVRHPSYGGHVEFARSISRLYRVESSQTVS